jgi:hypothetical protein
VYIAFLISTLMYFQIFSLTEEHDSIKADGNMLLLDNRKILKRIFNDVRVG